MNKFGILFLNVFVLYAAEPRDLPGSDISNEYIQQVIPHDSIASKAPASVSEANISWFDAAMKTWNAPPLSEQIAADNTNIPVGKGAIFIPRLSDAAVEPDVEIIDSAGNVAGRGSSGKNYAVLPGQYSVMLGSGSRKQRILYKVNVTEGKPIPMIPDWSGLSINIVDDNGIAFRGEYELARVDSFVPLGRGYGTDPNLGEQTKTWILKPGLYKIIGVGENYNTLNNFVTVQLLPGKLTKFLLIEDPASLNKITGGGIVDMEATKKLAKYWKYGVDIGGNVLLNAKIDHLREENNITSSTIAMLLNSWIRYEKPPYDWNTNLKINEGFALSKIDFRDPKSIVIEPSIDEPRLTSLFIWRFLPWFGPYGRFEATTTIFAKRVFPDLINNKPYFYMLNEDGSKDIYDTISTPREREPSFFLTTLTSSIGANMDLLKVRRADVKLRAGFAYEFTHQRSYYKIVDSSAITNTLRVIDSLQISRSTILIPISSITENATGPEA